MSGGENYISEAFEEIARIAREARCRELGMDEETFMKLMHGSESGAIYRGDIPEMPWDKYDYGTPRHSGRYPWGSGDNPYQRNASFLGKVDDLRKAKTPDGKRMFTDKQIAESMGMNTSDLRKRLSTSRAEERAYLSAEAKRLKAKGMSTSAIARRMGKNESSVRLLLDEEVNERMSKNVKNAILLKERVKQLKYIDVGKGSEEYLGLSSTAMGNTLHLLEQEGYTLHDIQIKQLGTGKNTTVKVLAAPGTDKKEVYANKDNIKLVKDLYSEDGGETVREIREYVSIDPKRVMINYPSDDIRTSGASKDGVIELRRGVPDLSLGKNNYAQVRILVDGDHYLKGMAMYADDLPDGVDIRFNTSKPEGTPMFKRNGAQDSVLKETKKGELDNPFGANIKPDEKLTRAQRHYIDENGVEQQSAINIVKEEGDVNDWGRHLASQFLSKQTPALAKQQLGMAYDISKADLEEIKGYTNPVVKASMLEDFAGRCETDATHLAAAALPRQNNKFILPLTNIKENEIYAPGYNDGEEVVLVRYPHGSISEIPRLIVNNNNKLARDIIGKEAIDAVGIHPAAAERLSGADFDGDTVLVIPTVNTVIRNKPQFESLKGFDPKEEYKGYPGMKAMTPREKGMEMGKVSNLITDMTIRGASDKEIAMALKHSMVVIDAEKHKLDFRRSEIDNHIDELKRKYQLKPDGDYGGASTLLSRSTSDERSLPERKLKAPSKMTPEEHARYLNGEQIWVNTGKMKKEYPLSKMTKEEKAKYKSGDAKQANEVRAAMISDGRVKYVPVSGDTVKKGFLVDDAYKLVSGGSKEKAQPIERVYADYANKMKDLAKEARRIARNQEEWKVDPEARKLYSQEVASLDEKLSVAKRNKPLERQAQILANKKMAIILQSNPELETDRDHLKKEKGRQLDAARKLVGAKKLTIGGSDKNPLTDREWKAIEAHAVSKSKLLDILANADKGRVRELAMPRTKIGLPAAKVSRAKAMLANGYSRAEVCNMLDISESKLINALDL